MEGCNSEVHMKPFLLAALAAIALSGCATKVADFEKMGPEKYAEKTCRNSTEIRNFNSEYQILTRERSRVSGNISRGYAIHTNCYSVSVPNGSDTNCYTDYFGKVICSTNNYSKTEQRCTETPVAISVDAEQKKLDSINDRIRYIEKNASEIYDRCYQKVLLMPPAEAFRYWKTRTLP